MDDAEIMPASGFAEPIYNNIPAALRALDQWVLWRAEWRRRPELSGCGKWNKRPVALTGGYASSTDLETWTDFARAMETCRDDYPKKFSGVGFVFTADDPYVGIDLDDARDPETGEPLAWAASILEQFTGTYTEVSPSGTGYKIFALGEKRFRGSSKSYGSGAVEVYDRGRYFTLTGRRIGEAYEITDCQEALDWLGDKLFRPPQQEQANGAAAADGDWGIIRNGHANNEILRRCGLLQAKGVPDEAIRAAAHGFEYESRPSDKDIDERVDYVLTKEKGEGTDNEPKRKSKQADLLVELAASAELFHDRHGNAYATIPVGGHRETWPVKSSGFKRWLQRKYWESDKSAPNAQAMTDALGVIEGQGVFDGGEYEVHIRVAGDHEWIVIDLGTADWSVVIVTAEGWRVETNSPIKFRRARGMHPLPVPERGGVIEDLRRFLNVRADDWPLVAAWLLMALNPVGPYPILNFNGEAGSGKSTATRVTRRLVDPNEAPLRREPSEDRDLVIAANNSWVVALDNLSRLPVWLSDGLCRLATGGGFATRLLYSNDEEAIFNAMRPAILNGIEDVAIRGDLMDRCLNITLERIPEDERKTEAEFWAAFDQAAPHILGALLDALAGSMRRLPKTRLDRLPRMADFARWAVAGEPGLGLAAGEFLAAYESARNASNDLVIESSPVGRAILVLLDSCREWEGTAGELLDALENALGEVAIGKERKHWPGSSRALSNQLRRLAPNLRASGIAVDFSREAGGIRRRIIHIERTGNLASHPSLASHPTEKFPNAKDSANAGRDAIGGTRDATIPAEIAENPTKIPIRDVRDERDAKPPAYSANVLMEF